MTVGVASAQVWNEVGDAGDLPATAQVPQGAGPITTIIGTILPGGDADMYLVETLNPLVATATTCNNGTNIDTQLWAFNLAGNGGPFNDDGTLAGCGLQSYITGSTCPTAPGCIYLAVSTFDWDALGPNGLEIWLDTPYGAVRCPDGPDAPGPVTSWGGTTGASGAYQIDLVGGTFCAVTPVEESTWGQIKSIY
jgi:hypothetical protein